jgi:hypothetical protein
MFLIQLASADDKPLNEMHKSPGKQSGFTRSSTRLYQVLPNYQSGFTRLSIRSYQVINEVVPGFTKLSVRFYQVIKQVLTGNQTGFTR